MHLLKEAIAEIRLLVCSYLFGLVLWISPKGHPEGVLIIDGVKKITEKSIAIMEGDHDLSIKKKSRIL